VISSCKVFVPCWIGHVKFLPVAHGVVSSPEPRDKISSPFKNTRHELSHQTSPVRSASLLHP
jgi:hypothetical protein